MLPHRPWTTFQNFIFREQKVPLGMLFNEALEEAMNGKEFQVSSYKNYKIIEEAPLPIMVFKWKDVVVKKYLKTISPFLDKRAKELLLPLIDRYGLGGVIYYYPYLPKRIHFESISNSNLNKKITTKEKLSAFKNLIDIQARMFLSGFMPFSFEDHGIGQCIAPQNVTIRGGICDLGSLKKLNTIKNNEIFILLRATGGILTRTFLQILGTSVKDIVYEFNGPTTIHHQLSAIVHQRMKNSLTYQSNKYSIKINKSIKKYYETDDKSLIETLGLNK